MSVPRSYGVLVCVAWICVGVLPSAGYECNYNASGPTHPIRPEVGEFGPIHSVNYPNGYGAYRSFCQVQIEACYGCTIQLKFEEAQLDPCPFHSVVSSLSSSCDTEDLCEYFIWSAVGRPALRLAGNLTSLSVRAEDTVTLSFCYSGLADGTRPQDLTTIHRWKAVFAIRDQFTYRVYGSAKQSGPNPAPSTGILRSPGFPLQYPDNHTTYFIQGIAATDRIRVVFDDFDIDPIASSLKIYDGPGRTTSSSKTYRTRDERPVFTSTSEYVLIEFFPGGRSNQPFMHMGFKATYEFIPLDSVSELPNPVHHKCSAVRPSDGGVVMQVGPSPGSVPVYHDCVWSLPTHYNLHMSVQIIQFKVSEVPSSRFPLLRQLEIRNAFHSDGKVLTILYSESQLPLLQQEYLKSRGGLYVRLRATLSDDSIVRFSYTPYRREPRKPDMHTGKPCDLERGVTGLQPGVLCEHGVHSFWCIPTKLACDNLTHCKNGGDEGTMCQLVDMLPVTSDPNDTPRVAPCKSPLYRCMNGRCVRRRSECYVPGVVCQRKGMEMCSGALGQCYKPEQRCDRHNDCDDWSDEHGCDYDHPDHRLSVFVQSLGNTWFFFLPAGILVLTFVIGCVIYKTRKFRRMADGEGYIGAAPTDDVQLHTFTATAPPPYEEVGPRSAATPAPPGPLEEREPLITELPVDPESLEVDQRLLVETDDVTSSTSVPSPTPGHSQSP